MTGQGRMLENERFLEVDRHGGPGYLPLVFSAGWQVAILNWEPPIDLANLGEIERHVETDEVFVLWRGRAAIFVKADDEILMEDMQPGVVYTVKRGSWHNLVASADVSLLIVENRDTHLDDTQLRQLDNSERVQILAQLPAWAGL